VKHAGRGRKKRSPQKAGGVPTPEEAWEGLSVEEEPSEASEDRAPEEHQGGAPGEEGHAPFPTEEAYEQTGWAETKSPEDHLDLLCFNLADEEFAIDIHGVWEIIRMRPTTEIPRSSSFIRGIISLRGEIVPVVDLRLLLGFQPPEDPLPAAKIIVATLGGKPVGMAVDAVTSKVRVPGSNVDLPPAVLGKSEAGHLVGVCRHQGRLISVLNTNAALGIEPEGSLHAEAEMEARGSDS
jgi:purine-binding chemotaxis protein CheW